MHSGVKRADFFFAKEIATPHIRKRFKYTHFQILINSFFTHKSKLRKYLQC